MKGTNKLIKDRKKGNAPPASKTAPQAPKKTGKYVRSIAIF